MNLDQLIKRALDALNANIAKRNGLTEQLNTLRGTEGFDAAREADLLTQRGAVDTERAELEASLARYRAEKEAEDAVARLQAQITLLGQQAGDEQARDVKPSGVRVGQEPRTYTQEKDRRGQASFFSDAYRAANMSDFTARERLERHMVEVRAEGELSERAVSTSGAAGLVIPQYLVDLAAPVVRSGRPVANAVTRLPLPAEGMTLVVPRGTTGASAASQATENSNVSNTDEVWSASLQPPVVTIAGQQDLARQLLERGAPGTDLLVYTDLAGAYMEEVDRQVVNGSGASNQMQGILQTSGTNQMSAFTAAATAQTFWTKWAGAKAAVNKNRKRPVTFGFMHPDRWGWLESLLDSQNRPLVVPNSNGPTNTYGVFESEEYGVVVGTLGTVPIITDSNVPTNVGTGPEDVVVAARAADLLLWEDGDGMPRELRFEQTLGNQLTIKLVVYGYAAFTAGRYPTAVSKVGGNAGTAGYGLVAPTF